MMNGDTFKEMFDDLKNTSISAKMCDDGSGVAINQKGTSFGRMSVVAAIVQSVAEGLDPIELMIFSLTLEQAKGGQLADSVTMWREAHEK